MPDITYTPFNADWRDSPETSTPITAASLEYIETGIGAVTTQANTALSTAVASVYAKAVKARYVTTGDITPPSDAAWTKLTGFEISIPAVSGDLISVDVGVMWNPNASSLYDLAVISGSSLVRFASSGGATPGTEGAVWFYPQTGFARSSPTWSFQAGSGDIDTATVRVVLAHKGTAAGTLFASTSYPFYWKITRERGAAVTVL